MDQQSLAYDFHLHDDVSGLHVLIHQIYTKSFLSYLQQSAEDPLTLPRKKALERIKRIASAQHFDAKVKWENFVKMPSRPTRARRSAPVKMSSIESDDEMFEVLVS